jgi:hypothetical protein
MLHQEKSGNPGLSEDGATSDLIWGRFWPHFVDSLWKWWLWRPLRM